MSCISCKVFSNSNASFYLRGKFIKNSRIQLQENLYNNYYDHWIQTEDGGYSFVTCYSESAITFDFYITPFQPELWYALLTFYLPLHFAGYSGRSLKDHSVLGCVCIRSTTWRWGSRSWEIGKKFHFPHDFWMLDYYLCISYKLLQWINDYWAQRPFDCNQCKYFSRIWFAIIKK